MLRLSTELVIPPAPSHLDKKPSILLSNIVLRGNSRMDISMSSASIRPGSPHPTPTPTHIAQTPLDGSDRQSSSSYISDSSDDDDDMSRNEQAEEVVADLNTEVEEEVPISETGVRVLALLCACSLSIGSHYGSYFLGPLKSRLSREIGTSDIEFSLLIAAYSLNNTWTPLVGGVMAARLGTGLSSIIATSLILVGQSILLLGDLTGSVKVMVFGLFVFGLGVSPLAVVQETIIVRFFAKHGLGTSLALGLVAGKCTSFLSALTSYPLSQKYGPHAPFIVSTILAATSFGFNIVYLLASSWFTRGARVAPEAADLHKRLSVTGDSLRLRVDRPQSTLGPFVPMSEREACEKVAARRNVKFWDLAKLGDVFWLYIGVNVLCGAIWSPFTHLAANIIEKRYDLSELAAGRQASMLLAGSIVLYPICGYLTDRLKHGPIVHRLFVLSSCLTLFCYFWLAMPPEWTESPTPAVIAFGGGHGFSTLLLVIIVPHIIPMQYVSTALGAHKSMESVGSTSSNILAGLLLNTKSKSGTQPRPRSSSSSLWHTAAYPLLDNSRSIQWLLNAWLFVNVLQLIGTLLLWKLDTQRKQSRRDGTYDAGSQPSSPIADARGGNNGYLALPGELVNDDQAYQEDQHGGQTALPIQVEENPWKDDDPTLLSHSISSQPSKYATWASPRDANRPLLAASGIVENSPPNSPLGVPSYTTQTTSPNTRRSQSKVSYLLPHEEQQRRKSMASPLLHASPQPRRRRSSSSASGNLYVLAGGSKREKKRGRFFMCLSGLMVLGTWGLFWGTVVAKIKQRNGSG